MKGIDIYHGDSTSEGSKLKAVPEKAYKESDFVIVKATQGVSYKYTSFFYKMIDRVINDGKLAGAYHYAAGNDPVKEADYFLKIVKDYIGKIMLCLDWEGTQNSKFGNKTWCTAFINRVKEKTGITCTLYTGEDGCKQNISLAGKVPLWFAGYPKPQATGWTVPKWKYNLGKWGMPLIWQYTSTNEKCDRNTSSMKKDDWQKYVEGKQVTKKEEPKYKATRDDVVDALRMLKGIKEGSKEHKVIIDTFNNSGLCSRYKMSTKDPWCATAVSFAFIVTKLAGKQGSKAPFQCVECSCAKMVELAKKQGIWIEKDSYIPTKGDVVLYDWQDSGKGDNTGSPDHVGIVEKVADGKIYVIEGNYSDSIKERIIPVNGKNIRGFITPAYTQNTAQKPQNATGAVSNVSYYKKYVGGSESLVDALKAVGADASKANRMKIAKANGISQYKYTASQNRTLLTMLKAGKLVKP